MVLAVALEGDVADQNHLAIALDLLENPVEHAGGILGVSGVEFLEGFGDPRRCLRQTFPGRVVAGPADEGAHRSLRLFPARAPCLPFVGSDRGQT
jgi:hypothetical protein